MIGHKSPERVTKEAGAAGAGEVLLGGLLAVLELLLEAAGAVLTRLPLAYGWSVLIETLNEVHIKMY